MRIRRLLLPLALAAALTAACGESGSSGTGGDSGGNEASGDACAPIAGDQLVVLEDDEDLQNADNVLPAVNAATAEANPALLPALDAVSAQLTTDDLIEMNAAVDVQRQSAEDVAAAWVEENGVTEGLEQGSGSIAIGGGNFSEPTILANIYADVLEAAGFDASVQATGNRELYLPALQRGEIQVHPEYLSTVTEFLEGDDENQVASNDVQATYEALQPLAEEAGLVFGEPAEAADQNAFAVTQAFADELGVSTLSELADACGDGSLVLGGPGECPTRPFCQPGLEDTYGLEFASFQEYDAGGPLTKAALQQGEISLGLVFSSDGALAQQD
ncbi:glycine betaine ABC transporter substrate-binding protein [Blastococcus sp. CCUG 61487]|uniref:glycine betaine ABC transporter substrate-binding protein n=1 Tax=Blastococcus sp. CCUG 61487 TaxID=1840703 RepID=UPI0010C05E2C|nr:glycine betaine ABC transporter substrate-binding protein [Blastococcus sp. CCUG 61487]TKJ31968.1 glycine/betaine ABC transporter substrate-binding protein [Blastococcus sp. CCUG 61487]